MSKARVDWTFGERPVSSSKMDQEITDYITPGVPIWSYFYKFSHATAESGGTGGAASTNGCAFFPYNPQKSVHNRLYLLGGAFANNNDESDEFDLSFDGGATWTPAFPSVTAAPVTIYSVTLAEIWDLDAQVATFQWIGWRWAGPPIAPGGEMNLALIGFLYNSTDNPF